MTMAAATTDRRRRTRLKRVAETVFCALAWTGLGLYLEIYGPNLIDLKIKLRANYDDVMSGVLGRSIGNFPGSVLGGVLVDKLAGYSHLFIALSLIVAGAVTVPVPWLPSVDYLWPLCFIGGFVESIINVAGQRIILDIWKEKSAAPMILLHGGYGIGSLLVPVFSNPFLAVKMDTPNNATNSSDVTSCGNVTTLSSVADTPILYSEESRIEYSFLISSIPIVLLSLVFFCYQIRDIRYMRSARRSTKDPTTVSTAEQLPKVRSFREMVDPGTCAGGHRGYAITMWIIIITYFANTNGGERVAAGFNRSYAVDQLGFDKSSASLLNTTFWVSFLSGRLFFFVLARWVSIRIILMVEAAMVVVVASLMNVFATDSTLAYWLLIQPLGFFVAPMYPSGVSWTDFHLELTGLGMMIILIGGSIGGTCHQKLIGYLYENKGTKSFLYQLVGYGVVAFCLTIILNVVGSRHGNRFEWEKALKEESKVEIIDVPTLAEKDEVVKDRDGHM